MESVTSVVVGRGRGRGRGRARSITQQEQVEVPSSSSVDPSQKVNSELYEDITSNPEDTHHLVENNDVIRKQRVGVPPTTSSNIKTEDNDHDSVQVQDWSDTLMTSSSSSSDHLSIKSIKSSTDPRVSPISSRRPLSSGKPEPKDFPDSYLLPKYFEPVKPTKRLIQLGSSSVKILKVLDDQDQDGKSIYVAFQDKDSLARFKFLLEKIGPFYSSPAGFKFHKPAKFLEAGEIVVANVSLCMEDALWRRVQVQRVEEVAFNRKKAFLASGIDIDNLSHWRFRNGFCLYEPFYDHPIQTCKIRIRNIADMYPKGVFDALFSEEKILIKVMNELSHKILLSMIGRNIKISNILESDDKSRSILTAEINLDLNWRLKTLYLEFFKDHFTPRVPEIGDVSHGTITDVLTDKTIGICLKDSLYECIDRIVNEIDFEKIKTPEDKLWTAIHTGVCKQFIGFNDDKSRLCRILVKSYHDKQLKVIYMDTAREKFMTVSELICSMTDNPNIPPVLSLVPAQGIRFKITGMQKLSPEECQNLYGKKVSFKLSRSSDVRDSMLEMEILDDSVHYSSSIMESVASVVAGRGRGRGRSRYIT